MKSQQSDTGPDAAKYVNLLLKDTLSIARQISQVDMATGNTGNQKAEQMFLKEKKIVSLLISRDFHAPFLSLPPFKFTTYRNSSVTR